MSLPQFWRNPCPFLVQMTDIWAFLSRNCGFQLPVGFRFLFQLCDSFVQLESQLIKFPVLCSGLFFGSFFFCSCLFLRMNLENDFQPPNRCRRFLKELPTLFDSSSSSITCVSASSSSSPIFFSTSVSADFQLLYARLLVGSFFRYCIRSTLTEIASRRGP